MTWGGTLQGNSCLLYFISTDCQLRVACDRRDEQFRMGRFFKAYELFSNFILQTDATALQTQLYKSVLLFREKVFSEKKILYQTICLKERKYYFQSQLFVSVSYYFPDIKGSLVSYNHHQGVIRVCL